MIDSSLRWAGVFVLACLATAILCRASAAARHAAWMCSLVALLLMPILVGLAPDWRVLPWNSSDSVAVFASPASQKSDADANPPQSQHIDSSELVATIPLFVIDAVNGDAGVTPISDLGQVTQPLGVWYTLLEKLGLLWSAGVTICIIRLIAGWIVVGKLVADADVDATDWLMKSVDSMRHRLGLNSPVRIYVTRHREMPMAWGIWRPAVLLPQEALSWDREQLDAVLLHELGHIHRRDPMTHLVAQLVCAMHWFNPLVWLAAWRLGVERERACDDLVLRAGLKPSTYAEQLLMIVSQFDSSRRLPSTALAMARRGRLETRISAILDPRTTHKGMTMRTFLLTLLIASVTTFAAATLHAQQKPAAKTTESQEQQVPETDINPVRNPGFEEGQPGNSEFAWQRANVSDQQSLKGDRSGFITSEGHSKRPGLLQGFDAKPFRGKRIRYRAAVRMESEDDGRAQLWFRVDRPMKDGKRPVGAFDNMHDRPIRASQWKYYDLVGDVHDDATFITFGLFLLGKGDVWIDDTSISLVGDDVKTTTMDIAESAAISTKVRNSGFEQGEVGTKIPDWLAAELNGYRATISDKEPNVAQKCGLLQRDHDKDNKKKHFGALNSVMSATPYRGKRVRFRAAVRTLVEGGGNEARLWFRVDRPVQDGKPVMGAFDNMHDRPITKTQWQYYDIIGDVAEDARGIICGLLLIGDGKAFIDDVSFEVVGDDVEPTAKVIDPAVIRTQSRETPISKI